LKNTLQGVMLETAKTTSLVFIILLGAAMLTAAFRAFGGEDLVREFLTGLPGGFWTQFIIVMLVIFLLGFFLDFIEIAVVVVPIVAPILLSDPGANITAVWLGVMIGLNIQTSFLTPPFGFALFYLRGVAPAIVRTVQIYKGVIPFIALQLVALVIVGSYPPLVNYLPNRVSLLSETSPPPRNPKLQVCLEDYVGEKLAESNRVNEAIAAARMLDLSALPRDLARDVSGSFEAAEEALAAHAEIGVAVAAVNAAAGEYRPVLEVVRGIEKKIRKAQEEADSVRSQISRMRGEVDETVRARLEAELAEHEAEVAALQAEIPSEWVTVHDAFAELTGAEDRARNTFRRAADASYEGAAEVLAVLKSNAAYADLKTPLDDIRSVIETGVGEEAEEAVKAVEDLFDGVEGARDVKSALSSARRALGRDRREDALESYQEARDEYASQIEWRADSAALIPGLEAYLDAVRDSIAIRAQDRLTREQALAMASCTAQHRDISLNF
jgi:hypothetical protein